MDHPPKLPTELLRHFQFLTEKPRGHGQKPTPIFVWKLPNTTLAILTMQQHRRSFNEVSPLTEKISRLYRLYSHPRCRISRRDLYPWCGIWRDLFESQSIAQLPIGTIG